MNSALGMDVENLRLVEVLPGCVGADNVYWQGCLSVLKWAYGQDLPPRWLGQTTKRVGGDAQPSAGTMRSGARGSWVQNSGKTRSPRGPGAWKAKSRSSERPS